MSNQNSAMLILSLTLAVSLSVIAAVTEASSTIPMLSSMSCVLLATILFSQRSILAKADGLANPYSIFSMMYCGYALGGLYYSQSDGYFGKFLTFANLDIAYTKELMLNAIGYALLCFIVFALGYRVALWQKRHFKTPSFDGFELFLVKLHRPLVFLLVLAGAGYWYFVATSLSPNVFVFLKHFQAFEHMVRGSGISILPYQLYYAGVYIWLICLMKQKKRLPWSFYPVSLFGVIMDLSTGRITLAFTYLTAQLILFYILRPDSRRKLLFSAFALLIAMLVTYFLRELSNWVYIGYNISDYKFDGFLKTMIGSGNVTDIQQLVLIFHTFDQEWYLLGSSYSDWFTNTFGKFWGAEPASIGLLIHKLYVPSSSGAPTPGAIGEGYANFGAVFILLFGFVGLAFGMIRNTAISSSSYIVKLVYAVFLARFCFLYPKVDSTMLVNFLVGVVPTLLIIGVVYVFYALAKIFTFSSSLQ